MKSFAPILFLGLIILRSALGQTAKLDSLIDDLILGPDNSIEELFQAKSVYHFIYARANTDTKTFYAGREIGDNMQNANAQITYFNTLGLYASVAGYWYSQSDPAYSLTLASVGYSNSLKALPQLRYRASYDHFFYNLSGSDYSPEYFGSLNIGSSYRLKWGGVNLDASFLLGSSFKASYSASAYAKLYLLKFKNKGKIYLRPRISLYMGDDEVENYNIQTDEYSYEEKTGLINTQFTLPLHITYRNFDISVAFRYNVPRSLDPLYEYDSSTYFSFSIGYFFDLD